MNTHHFIFKYVKPFKIKCGAIYGHNINAISKYTYTLNIYIFVDHI